MGDAFERVFARLVRRPTRPASKVKVSRVPVMMIWTLKKGKRVASGTDTWLRALAVRANQLHRLGLGGGVSSLLIPTDSKGLDRLDRDRRDYQLVLVRSRNPGLRAKIRSQATDEAFLKKLRQVYGRSRSPTKKALAEWVITELQIPGSEVRNLASLEAPDLLDADRSPSWLRRLKMSR